MADLQTLPRFILPCELQQALGGEGVVSLRTITRWARDGKIPGAVRLGRRLVFQRQPVMSWIEGGAAGRLVALPKGAA